MGRRNKSHSNFEPSVIGNNATWRQYFDRLRELSMSMFEWKNLPETVDERYLEMILFYRGQAIFFEDEVLGYLCLKNGRVGKFDVYHNPVYRRAYADNGYNKDLDDTNSVMVWNNYLRTGCVLDVEMFAQRLYNIDRTIDVNVNAQKTPILIQGTEEQKLPLLNLYKEYQGNSPVIFGDKHLDVEGLTVLQTNAPYVSDKLYELKTQIWNEALTYLGISNVSYQKRERLISDEVNRAQGGTVASRYSRLAMRQQACEKINKMFGLNISVDYREDYPTGNLELEGDASPIREEINRYEQIHD